MGKNGMTIKTTKEKIIFEALKLFSKDGFEASSTRAIARSINCSDAVIYKHFKSKQEILDAIVEICSNRLMEKSSQIKIEEMCWKDVEKICLDMFEFQTTDEWMVTFRRILLMEQFKNKEIAELYKSCFIEMPVEGMEKIFAELMENGMMKKKNSRVLAMELYAPFFLYHLAADDMEKLRQLFREHVRYFFEENLLKGKKK